MDKILKYLSSQDIELAQLGCILLQDLLKDMPRDVIEIILKDNLHPAFAWDLDKGKILVRHRRGIWEQLDKGYTSTYWSSRDETLQ